MHPSTIRRRSFAALTAALLGMALTVFVMPHAFAASPEKKFKGKIIVSKDRFPSRFKSDSAMIKHMKKVNTHELFAEGDDDWEFEYMAFCKKKIGTLQAAVTFYDITVPGTEKLINTYTFYPADQTDKILNGHQRLAKKRFSKDRKYLMVLSRGYGQQALAKTQIVLRRK